MEYCFIVLSGGILASGERLNCEGILSIGDWLYSAGIQSRKDRQYIEVIPAKAI